MRIIITIKNYFVVVVKELRNIMKMKVTGGKLIHLPSVIKSFIYGL